MSEVQNTVEEHAQANLYRHLATIFEKNHRGVIKDQFGSVAETMRSRLLVGLGAGVLLTGFGITSGEPFIVGMGFLPLVVFGVWLLVRRKTAGDALKKQLEILAWFKARGKPFPYENAAEIIDPLERLNWEDAHRLDGLKRELAELAEKNWDDAVIIARRNAALPMFGRLMIEKARQERDQFKKQATLVRLLQAPAAFSLERDELLAVFPLLFWDWEGRPVITQGYYRAWAMLGSREGWTPVSIAEVIDSGRQISPEAFGQAFRDLPPVPYRS